MIELGDKVKDVVTGFTGIAVGRVEWIYGCIRWIVQPQVKANKHEESQNFDEGALTVVKKGAVKRPAWKLVTCSSGPAR